MAGMPVQVALFGDVRAEQSLLPHDGFARYRPAFLPPSDADALFAALLKSVAWRQEVVTMFGRRVAVPRLVAWYGDPSAAYRYSGVRHQPLPWLDALADLRDRLHGATGGRFNSALLNLYRDGSDSVAWHADDEPELGREPLIASVSLGAERAFELRDDARVRGTVRVWLAHGSLLLMGGTSQSHWQHRVAKTSRPVGPRINLTFRFIAPA